MERVDILFGDACVNYEQRGLVNFIWSVLLRPPSLLSDGQTESQVDASWKLGSTCDSVWPRLACTCVALRCLAMACAQFGRDQIRTQVKASSSPFGHPTQVNPSWVTPINLLLANEIRYMSALKWVSLQLACTCAETCQCVWPPNASPYASSTCVLLRLLAGPFDQYFIIEKHDVVPNFFFSRHFTILTPD